MSSEQPQTPEEFRVVRKLADRKRLQHLLRTVWNLHPVLRFSGHEATIKVTDGPFSSVCVRRGECFSAS